MELTIQLPHGDDRVMMTGVAEQNLKIIREALGVKIAARNGSLRISGDSQAVGGAARVLEQLSTAARRRQPLDRRQILKAITAVGYTEQTPVLSRLSPAHHDEAAEIAHFQRQLPQVKALTQGQALYLDAIANHDLTICVGPAGTGKTYLAVAAAVGMLRADKVRKLVLARPAVEAGERLGFLPGNMHEKVNPYLRPLFDALHDLMDFDQIQRMMACDLIEIIPLAFMRGRTLNNALVILDEAQNTTREQMLMFLTRLGESSRMIVTGDTSQVDLQDPTRSGLVDAARRLARVKGIAFVTLGQTDIVRHHLVQRIVDAYGQDQKHQ
ncbi:MAG: PhoH family protein [Phycisphaeraceae bacterium]|nr:PhoH family protein [Phycisphaeraceae bacterium]